MDVRQEFKKLRIDLDALDEECVMQCELVGYFGTAHVKAKDQVAAWKKHVSTVEAQTDKRMRDEAAAMNRKMMENQIKAAMELCEEVINAQAGYRQAELTMDLAWIKYQAVQSRGRQLDNLVRLYNAEYFSRRESADQRAGRVAAIETRIAEIMEASENV